MITNMYLQTVMQTEFEQIAFKNFVLLAYTGITWDAYSKYRFLDTIFRDYDSVGLEWNSSICLLITHLSDSDARQIIYLLALAP